MTKFEAYEAIKNYITTGEEIDKEATIDFLNKELERLTARRNYRSPKELAKKNENVKLAENIYSVISDCEVTATKIGLDVGVTPQKVYAVIKNYLSEKVEKIKTKEGTYYKRVSA